MNAGWSVGPITEFSHHVPNRGKNHGFGRRRWTGKLKRSWHVMHDDKRWPVWDDCATIELERKKRVFRGERRRWRRRRISPKRDTRNKILRVKERTGHPKSPRTPFGQRCSLLSRLLCAALHIHKTPFPFVGRSHKHQNCAKLSIPTSFLISVPFTALPLTM